jgi:hypothetical protein
MTLSGTVRFNELNPESLQLILAFEAAHVGSYTFNYENEDATVTIRWHKFHELTALIHLAAEVEVRPRKEDLSHAPAR